MTSFFILLSSIYSHSVYFQNLLRAEKLFHFKFPIDWYITLTCLSNFNFEVFFQAAIMNYAQYGVMPRCCRWGFLICVSWHLPLTLCKISALYVFFSGLGGFLANSPILKTQKSRYFENKISFFLQIKKSINYTLRATLWLKILL